MKILIAIDGSECSATAFRSVAERAWPAGTEFRLITVLESLFSEYALGGGYAFEKIYENQTLMIKDARKFLDDKIDDMRAIFGQSSVTQVLFEGSVPNAIIDEAKRWDADLIVLGSHGRKGLQRFLLGSVAEKVASYCTCSVEIIKDKTAVAKEKGESVRALPLKETVGSV
jgi:nucleotide-binding universal stress UspA family protein